MMELLSVMTVYEWCRVIIAFCNLVAVLGVPFVMVWLEKRNRDDKK